MKKLQFDQILCEDSNNIDQILSSNSVSLSIVVPPYTYLKNYYSDIAKLKKQDPNEWAKKTETGKHLAFIEKTTKKIAKVTKPGGICCLIVTNDMDPSNDVMIPTGNRIFVQLMNSKDTLSNWEFEGEFIWVKSSKASVEALAHMDSGTMVSYDQTPFSTIYILVRKGKNVETSGILERLVDVPISEEKKTEISDTVWFVPYESLNGFRDHLPKEIILRLIMVFSNENDLVLDPFANYGITAIASKILKRHYFCLDKNSKKIDKAKERIKTVSNA